MGFTAIWISPVTAQVPEAYHGYYQTNLYETNSNFGSAQDLKDLAAAAHSKGMYLMVDVVPNHMGWAACHDTVDYKSFHLFNNAEHYHSYCPLNNVQNQTEVETCWLGNCNMTMPDLKTENPDVAREMNTWIKTLVSNYSIDGLRIDSVKNVNKIFFPPWCEAAGVFCMGEVSDGLANYTYPYQRYMDSVLDYPLYYAINRAFQKQSPMADLVVNLVSCTQNAEAGCKDSTLLGTFFENHDNPRLPFTTNDMSLVKNPIAFTIMSDGIPILYQGQEQHLREWTLETNLESSYDTNSPLYKYIAYLNQIWNHISAKPLGYLTWQTHVLSYTSDTIQLRKDIIRTILTNQGEFGGEYTQHTQGMLFSGGETSRGCFDV
ncbi:glycoside hydrolase family 13 protein [Zopfia rhizophila CBS 207.26]|uniref:alpha-amylase n=1 Tax=Zopfia rhizophila CBS 207.26 TaxID=1314779 RepID=A0A6A6E947_9PEZI|nr:glycoside hydrolase family 13 protein [Zopfia rhizophila CBS 207.26]